MAYGLGKLIVERRKQLGLSQQQLARQLGISAANLSQIEHSPRRWRWRLLPALAEALAIPQLELAIAAGLITDLPPLPELQPDDNGSGSPAAQALAKRSGPASVSLDTIVQDLDPEDVDFLLEVAERLRLRRDRARIAPTP